MKHRNRYVQYMAGCCLVACMLCLSEANAQKLTGVYIRVKEKKAYKEIEVNDSTGVVQVKDSLNSPVILRFPQGDINYNIQFNKDKKIFSLSFKCSSDSCIQILPADVEDNEVKLTFINNNLIAIGKRLLETKRTITDKEPYIKLIVVKDEKPKDMYDELTSVKTAQKAMVLDAEKIEAFKFYCGDFKCKKCDDVTEHIEKGEPNRKVDAAAEKFGSDQLFRKVFDTGKITSTYWIVYDNRDGQHMTMNCYRISNNGKEIRVKKVLRPRVGRQTTITVIGPADTLFYTINGVAVQYFQEQEPAIAGIMTSVSSIGDDGEKEPENKEEPEAKKDLKKTLEELAADKSFVSQKRYKLATDLQDLGLTSTIISSVIKDNKSVNALSELIRKNDSLRLKIKALNEQQKKLEQSFSDLQRTQQKTQHELNSAKSLLKTAEATLQVYKDSVQRLNKTIDSLVKLIAVYPSILNLAAKYQALERDLEVFLADHEDISFSEEQYNIDRTCLQLKIKQHLGVPAPAAAKDLAQLLINQVIAHEAPKEHYKEFASLIKQIEFNYKAVLALKPRYHLYSVSKTIDNADEYSVTVKSPKGNDFGLNSTFYTSMGCKIDFSTGIYVSGLANNSFVLAAHQYSYKEARDSIGTDGSVNRIYTGRLIDTTGNLIQRNSPKYSYSAGLLVHVYPRTGTFVNFGAVTGITITNSNSSPIQLMLGLSAMFRAGKSRISLSGGLIFGQVKTLSSVATPHEWDGTPDKTVYNLKQDLPLFYTSSSDLPTYDRWRRSIFVGLSYNFASLNVGNND
ncbi:MAG: hypothetical protein ACTHMM_06225 [Agriterribacter sp.]